MGKSVFAGVKRPGRVGRPSIYTPDILDRICERLSNGEAMRSICASADMPDRSTVQRWIARAYRAARLRAALIAAGELP